MTGTVRSLVRATVVVDRDRVDLRGGLRTALGVALPLLVGIAVDRPLDGAVASGGAFFAGFAVFASGYRARLSAVLLAAACVAVSSFAGAVVGDVAWLLPPTVALWSFAAGLAVSLGLAAGIIGTQSVIALLVMTQYSMPVEDAAGRAALVLVGGLVQALLVVAVWPLRRSPVERGLLAAAYRSLAGYARSLPRGASEPPEGSPLSLARAALGDPQPFARGDQALVFQGLTDEGERLRTTLAALAHLRPVVAGVPVRADAVRALDDLLLEAAGLLSDVALAIEQPRAAVRTAALQATGPQAAPQRWGRLTAAVGALAHEAAHAGPARHHLGPSLVGEVERLASELLGHLRAVARLAGETEPQVRPAPGLLRSPLAPDVAATLRANLTLRSAALRHALRLAATVGLGAALALALPFEHRYWLPVTVLSVLRTDFTSTFSRGFGRIAGTVVGAVLATSLAAVLQPGPLLLALLVTLAAWGGYAVLFANYGLFALSVTGFVVFVLAFTGLPGTETVVDRVEATVLGGLLALLAYVVWPTWERVRLPEQLARLLEAQERYAGALLGQYADPSTVDAGMLQERRAAARLARTNAEASVDRVLAEPGGRRSGLPVPTVERISAATRSFALAALALQAHLAETTAVLAPGVLSTLRAQLGEAMRVLAVALRSGRPPAELPPLRQTQEQLRTALRGLLDDAAQGSGAALDAAVLDVEVDQLVASLLAVEQELRGVPRPAGRRRRRT